MVHHQRLRLSQNRSLPVYVTIKIAIPIHHHPNIQELAGFLPGQLIMMQITAMHLRQAYRLVLWGGIVVNASLTIQNVVNRYTLA